MKKIFKLLILILLIITNTTINTQADDSLEQAKSKVRRDCMKKNYLFFDTESEAIQYIDDYFKSDIPYNDNNGFVVRYQTNSVDRLQEYNQKDEPYGNSYAEFIFKREVDAQLEDIDGYNFALVKVRRIAKEEHYSSLTQQKANLADKKATEIAKSCQRDTVVASIKAVYNYLCDNITYDNTYKKGSIYDALIDGNSVCSGFAGALQLIMEKMGVQCYLVSGNIDGMAHVWNAVLIEGKYYYVDATFAVTTRYKGKFWLFGADTRPDLYNIGLATNSYSKSGEDASVETTQSTKVTEDSKNSQSQVEQQIAAGTIKNTENSKELIQSSTQITTTNNTQNITENEALESNAVKTTDSSLTVIIIVVCVLIVVLGGGILVMKHYW